MERFIMNGFRFVSIPHSNCGRKDQYWSDVFGAYQTNVTENYFHSVCWDEDEEGVYYYFGKCCVWSFEGI